MRGMAEKRNLIVAITTRIVVSVVILTASVGIFIGLWMTRPEPQRRTEEQPLRRVVVMQTELVEVRRQFEGFGTAEAMNTADIPARVTATVVVLPDDILPGARVEQGQIIAMLDPTDFERQVDIAEAVFGQFLDGIRFALELNRFACAAARSQQLEVTNGEIALRQDV